MTGSMNLFLRETFDSTRLEILPMLLPIKMMGFYLAGGTALALQFGHRQSVDFDFFRVEWFDPGELFETMQTIFTGKSIKKTFESTNTLYFEVDGVKFSFFGYKYPLIEPMVETEYMNLASLLDIAAMKLFAIQNRATKKDYVDMYYLLKRYPLKKLFEAFSRKFGPIVSEMILKKSLVYFDDIEDDPIILNDTMRDFELIKTELVSTIKNS